MATIKKTQKLCWNCEGEVDRESIVCLFCGSNLSINTENIVPSAYNKKTLTSEEINTGPIVKESSIENPREEECSLIAMIFLLPAIVFFMFALLLLFFSSNDVLLLRWEAHTWYLYIIISLPLFYFSYRLLFQVKK